MGRSWKYKNRDWSVCVPPVTSILLVTLSTWPAMLMLTLESNWFVPLVVCVFCEVYMLKFYVVCSA